MPSEASLLRRPEAYFVTGTDTGVGKTLVSAALLHALAKRHARVVGMKPVAAGGLVRDHRARQRLESAKDGEGGEGGEASDVLWANEDVLALRAASTLRVPPELDNPVLLPEPLSPHLAAQRAGQRIEIATLQLAFDRLQALADAVVVEGAGGWLVPLDDQHTLADLAKALGLPVVLVVGLRLGCLNHALLTAATIRASGLVLAGWVANRIDPDMACADENLAYLQQHLAAPLLGDIAFSAAPDAAAVVLRLPGEPHEPFGPRQPQHPQHPPHPPHPQQPQHPIPAP